MSPRNSPGVATVLLGVALLAGGATLLLADQAQADEFTIMELKLPRNTDGTSFAWTGAGTILFGGQLTDLIYHHDPGNVTVTHYRADLPSERTHTSSVWTGEHAYVFGGYGLPEEYSRAYVYGQNRDMTNSPYLDGIVRFDPAEDQASVMDTRLPSKRFGTSAVWTGEYAYIFGGVEPWRDGKTPIPLDEILRYDPANDQLTTLETALPSSRWHTTAVWTGEEAYILGGTNGQGDALDEILRFDPDIGTVEVVNATLPTGRWFTSAVWTGEHIHLFGGKDHARAFAEILRFDPVEETVESMESRLPFPMWSVGAVWTGETAYLYGGVNQTANFAWTYRYDPYNQPPEPGFTYRSNGTQLHVNASGSYDSDGTIEAYSWDWGDGSPPSQGPLADHTYAHPGTYNVTLTVLDDAGLGAALVRTITISEDNQAPVADFEHFRRGATVTVDASRSFDPDGSIRSISWDWGDGSPPGAGETATHTYASPGAYNITLKVTDGDDARATDTREIVVSELTANSRARSGTSFELFTDGLTVVATATDSADPLNTSYEWDWGDGTVSHGASTVRYTYDAPGLKKITLTVEDATGWSDQTAREVTLGGSSELTLHIEAVPGTQPGRVGAAMPVRIHIANSGGATATTGLIVSAGEAVLSEESVTVDPGSRRTLHTVFVPDAPGEHRIQAVAGAMEAETVLHVEEALDKGVVSAIPSSVVGAVMAIVLSAVFGSARQSDRR